MVPDPDERKILKVLSAEFPSDFLELSGDGSLIGDFENDSKPELYDASAEATMGFLRIFPPTHFENSHEERSGDRDFVLRTFLRVGIVVASHDESPRGNPVELHSDTVEDLFAVLHRGDHLRLGLGIKADERLEIRGEKEVIAKGLEKEVRNQELKNAADETHFIPPGSPPSELPPS